MALSDRVEQLEARVTEIDDELGQIHASLERMSEELEAAHAGRCGCESCRRENYLDAISAQILCALILRPNALSRAELIVNAIEISASLARELDAYHGRNG